jgi:hypothetical protein
MVERTQTDASLPCSPNARSADQADRLPIVGKAKVIFSCPDLPTLFLKLAFFWRIGGAFEVDAVAVGIGERYYPQAVSNKWTLLCLYSS